MGASLTRHVRDAVAREDIPTLLKLLDETIRSDKLRDVLLAVDTRDNDCNGGTLLHWSVKRGRLRAVQLLLKAAVENGPNGLLREVLSVVDWSRCTPLLAATSGHGTSDSVAAILEIAAENGLLERVILATDAAGTTPLHNAAKDEDPTKVIHILEWARRHTHTRSLLERPSTSSEDAGKARRHSTATQSLSERPSTEGTGKARRFTNPNLLESKLERSIKVERPSTGSEGAVKALTTTSRLLRKVLLAVNWGDELPLHCAIRYGAAACVDVLLTAASEDGCLETVLMAVEMEEKHTALHSAVSSGEEGIVQSLLQAAWSHHHSLLQDMLLAEGTRGITPLHEAAARGHSEIAEIILREARQCGMIVEVLTAETEDGEIPLEWASRCRRYEKQTAMVVVILQTAQQIGKLGEMWRAFENSDSRYDIETWRIVAHFYPTRMMKKLQP